MAIDERTRHEMYLGLEQLLGPHVADALMEHLPPVGWADVATKRDLDALEERLDLRFDGLERRLDLKIDAAISAATSRLLVFMMPTVLTAIGLGIAASRLG